MGQQLLGLTRCPQCSIAAPTLARVWGSEGPTVRRDGGVPRHWATYLCISCGSAVSATGVHDGGAKFIGVQLFPEPKQAHEDIPPVARQYLQQAYDTLHAPDAAAVMAGSAVDAMLKEKGLTKGSLYDRIDEALAANLLTKEMAEWAHSVRLGSNRPRHADASRPHVLPDEAKQSVDFAEALGNFLFVLSAKITRGIAAATGATPP